MLLTALVLLLAGLFRVPEQSQAIITRLGKPIATVNTYNPRVAFGQTDAGLVWKVPFLDNVIMVDKRVLPLEMPEQTVLTTDQRLLQVDAFGRFRITDPLRMYLTAGTEENVKEALERILASRLRNELGKQPFEALLSPERTQLMDDIQHTVNVVARNYGAEIVDVRIKQADLPAGAPLDSAYARMRTAREQEAGTIEAEGRKAAQLLVAQADADAAHIYADAYGRDPSFYAFYRSMQAYRTAFPPENTTMVLSPNNDFLREFEGHTAAK